MPVVLVTGAGVRIGACIARTLHAAGMQVALHAHGSTAAAAALAEELPGSQVFAADLTDPAAARPLIESVRARKFRSLCAAAGDVDASHSIVLGSPCVSSIGLEEHKAGQRITVDRNKQRLTEKRWTSIMKRAELPALRGPQSVLLCKVM